MATSRRVLMFAFQFPPYDQSTGSQRILGFARHLPSLGWSPIVITAKESAYPQVDPATLATIPPETTVIRAFAFDVARKLSIRGAYPRVLATPDRWNSWILGGAFAGLKAVRAHRPAVLWATFPTPSAIAAALLLRRLTGIPLVGDLRDPMLYESWPETAFERSIYGFLERSLVRNASAIVLTTPSACALYRARYPTYANKFHSIPNGMEPSADLLQSDAANRDEAPGITLVHSGLMEIPDRDPTAFFEAIRLLLSRGQLSTTPLRIILRASGKEARYAEAVRDKGIDAIVKLMPRVTRIEAIQEMKAASGLLLFQGKHCNRQIPAKAYEYLFLGKPLIGLLHAAGDTHALVHDEWNVPYCADMDDPEDIARTLAKFIADYEKGSAFAPPASLREHHSRRGQTVKLARLLDDIAARTNQNAERSGISRGDHDD